MIVIKPNSGKEVKKVMKKIKHKNREKITMYSALFLCLAVLFLISMLLLISCNVSICNILSRNDSGKGMQKITVVLDWVPNTNHTGIYVAKENKYFSQEGLEVEIIQPSEGGSADLIAAEQGQFCISYQEQVTYEIGRAHV